MTAHTRSIGTLLATMGTVLALAACGGDAPAPPDDGGGDGGGEGGTLIGDPVSATIGAAGGTLATPDGAFTLVVPAGALAAATELTVQQVVNEAPYGVGKSYRLSPANVTFAEPVDISIAVDSAELGELVPEGLVVGLQNGAGDWFAKLRSGVRPEPLGTSAGRAASVANARRGTRIGTFTEFDGIDSNDYQRIAIVAFWVVEPSAARVRVGDTQNLRVLVCTRNEVVGFGTVGGEDDLAALPGTLAGPPPSPPQGCAPSVRQGFWYVNNVNGGNGVVGTVTAGSPSSTATFRAPATVPDPATVTVTAEMTWSRNGDVVDFNIPIDIYTDGWQGAIRWKSSGGRAETYENGSLVITYLAQGSATYAPFQVDENGGVLRASTVSAGTQYKEVLTSRIFDGRCTFTTTKTLEFEGQLTTLPPAGDLFSFAWDVTFLLRGDGQYVIAGGIGAVPTTQTETDTETTVCPGSPDRVVTDTRVTQSFDGAITTAQTGAVRPFSPADKVFKDRASGLYFKFGDFQVLQEVDWEFTRP
jgi:hypothetical protein